MNSIKNKGTHT